MGSSSARRSRNQRNGIAPLAPRCHPEPGRPPLATGVRDLFFFPDREEVWQECYNRASRNQNHHRRHPLRCCLNRHSEGAFCPRNLSRANLRRACHSGPAESSRRSNVSASSATERVRTARPSAATKIAKEFTFHFVGTGFTARTESFLTEVTENGCTEGTENQSCASGEKPHPFRSGRKGWGTQESWGSTVRPG
jgi:hypothetical protein